VEGITNKLNEFTRDIEVHGVSGGYDLFVKVRTDIMCKSKETHLSHKIE
jgi:hypothetical protein